MMVINIVWHIMVRSWYVWHALIIHCITYAYLKFECSYLFLIDKNNFIYIIRYFGQWCPVPGLHSWWSASMEWRPSPSSHFVRESTPVIQWASTPYLKCLGNEGSRKKDRSLLYWTKTIHRYISQCKIVEINESQGCTFLKISY